MVKHRKFMIMRRNSVQVQEDEKEETVAPTALSSGTKPVFYRAFQKVI